MKILASVSKNTKKSGVSTWHFCTAGQSFFAINDDLKIIRCKSRKDLRAMYQKYAGYGYTPVTM